MSKKVSLEVWGPLGRGVSFFIYFTDIAGQKTLLMTILGLQSFGRFRAERRFNATHGWAPGFDTSCSDSHENIGNQQRLHNINIRQPPKRPDQLETVSMVRFWKSIRG